MRWPRRSPRKDADRANPLGSYTPGSWAQAGDPGVPSVVMPPPETTVTVVPPPAPDAPVAPPPVAVGPPPFVQPPLVAAPPADPLPPAPSPSIPISPAPSPSIPMPPLAEDPMPTSDPAVRLGFVDGTGFELHPEDPNAVALKAVAEVLTLRGPHPLG